MENDREQVYNYFMNRRLPVKFSTYAIFDGVLNFDYVVVHSAPPKVMAEIMGFCKMVSLTEQGMLIPLSKKKEN